MSLMDPSELYSISMKLRLLLTVVVLTPGKDDAEMPIESVMALEKV